MVYYSPLEQFYIIPFSFGLNIFFYFLLLFFVVCYYIYFSSLKIIPTYLQYFFEKFYWFFFSLYSEQILNFGFGKSIFPFFFCLSINLMFFNFIGMLPFSFAITSQFIICLFFSTVYFLFFNYIAVRIHKINFLSIFLPNGIPTLLLFMIVLLEVFSYVLRLLSLAIRLFANIVAGHTLLKILISFLFLSLSTNMFILVIDILPLILIHIIILLELVIAFIQVYVFYMLSCNNFRDSMILPIAH
jgi:F-type H+-transporting ATPase subunit a